MRPYGLAVLRLCVGAVFIAHGAQKLFGVWDGPGLSGTARMLGGLGFPYPYPFAILLAVAEFGGGALLVVGSLTGWASFALAVDMVVAVWKVHYANGFFLKPAGAAAHGQGFEYNFVLLGALVCLMVSGAGAMSLDQWRSQSAEATARGRARARKV